MITNLIYQAQATFVQNSRPDPSGSGMPALDLTVGVFLIPRLQVHQAYANTRS
jgi:hypothetical protein